MFTRPLCRVLNLVEGYAARSGGWKKKLYTLTMCDIAMNDVPALRHLKNAVVGELLPLMASTYGCDRLRMKSKNTPHITKYDAAKQNRGV